jgi:hypothetical protein
MGVQRIPDLSDHGCQLLSRQSMVEKPSSMTRRTHRQKLCRRQSLPYAAHLDALLL